MCSSFGVFLLIASGYSVSIGRSSAKAAHGACTGGNTFAIESELGERREPTWIPTPVWSQPKEPRHDPLLTRVETSQRRLRPRLTPAGVSLGCIGGVLARARAALNR